MYRRTFPFTPLPSNLHTFQGGGSLVSGLLVGSRWGCVVASGHFPLGIQDSGWNPGSKLSFLLVFWRFQQCADTPT